MIRDNQRTIDQRTIDRGAFAKALRESHLTTRQPLGPVLRPLVENANQQEPNADPVVHTETGFTALYDNLAARFGDNGAGALELRDTQGQLTEVGRAVLDLFEKADTGDRFWTRPELLKVQVTQLPAEVDPWVLRDGGIDLEHGLIQCWFGGPSSETLGGAAQAGIDWAVEHQGLSLAISGNTSLWDPCPTWRAKVPKHANLIPGDPGKENFKLAQNNRDPSVGGRNVAARALLAAAGVPVGRVRPAEVSLRFGEQLAYQGLRLLVESPDATIARLFPFHTKGNLYDLNWPLGKPANFAVPPGQTVAEYLASHKDTYELKGDNDDEAHLNHRGDLARLVELLHQDIPPAELGPRLLEVLDVHEWLRTLAVSVAIGNWDGYVETASNLMLYNSGRPEDAREAKENGDDAFFMQKPYFHVIPNDFDNSFGISYQKKHDGQFINWAHVDIFAPHREEASGPEMPLIDKVLAVPAFRQYYVDFLDHFLENIYRTDDVLALLGMELAGPSGQGYWGVVQEAAEREGSFSQPTRTHRPFTNDQVYWNGVRHHELGDDVRRIFGIPHHMDMARSSIRQQIDAFRAAGHPRVYSEFTPPGGEGREFAPPGATLRSSPEQQTPESR